MPFGFVENGSGNRPVLRTQLLRSLPAAKTFTKVSTGGRNQFSSV